MHGRQGALIQRAPFCSRQVTGFVTTVVCLNPGLSRAFGQNKRFHLVAGDAEHLPRQKQVLTDENEWNVHVIVTFLQIVTFCAKNKLILFTSGEVIFLRWDLSPHRPCLCQRIHALKQGSNSICSPTVSHFGLEFLQKAWNINVQ